mgnify:CR=1 FL=1|jgi:hypothetical protein
MLPPASAPKNPLASLPIDQITARRISEADWRILKSAHERRVEPWIAPRLRRKSRGERHPVEDFLFDYYPNRPSLLRRWTPGPGVTLLGDSAAELPIRPSLERHGDGFSLPQPPPARRPFIEWLRRFLEACAARPPFFGCHGLHEWAMVYRTSSPRHESLPLRLSPESIAAVVESLPVRCSHYDAFRFFMPEARPLNRLQPTREASIDLEQPACLHANMDLYKWCFKLSPWCPSELTADAFELAREIRELDMRASPYDVSAYGLELVAIETPSGRSEYEYLQRAFAERARLIRARLIALCSSLID